MCRSKSEVILGESRESSRGEAKSREKTDEAQ